MKKGLLIVLTGPSGVGKRTAWQPIINDKDLNLIFSVSMTTRPKRINEVEGVDYFFVSKEEFKKAIAGNKLLEYAIFADNYYGTPKEFVEKVRNSGKNVFLEIEPQGGLNIIKLCKKENDDGLLTIFIIPPSLEDLKNRLQNRKTESEEVINRRLQQAKWEINQSSLYQHVLVNKTNSALDTTKQIKEIILDRIKNGNK